MIHTCTSTWTVAHMKQSNNDMHSDDNSSDKAHISVDTQQDNTKVNKPNMAKWEDNTETNNANMPQSKHISGLKIIWTRSGWISHKSQVLGIMEEQ